MELVQSRVVTDDVATLAGFYARLIGVAVVLNDYYVEVPAGDSSVAFSKCRFTEYSAPESSGPRGPLRGEVILDFRVEDVDAEFERIDRLNVDWVLTPTDQPWGNRSMVFRDPQGNLVNVFSPIDIPSTEGALP
jgi:catechol 2,3-dioxygenase-like lactoylglutathione lyase family enzyme